MKKFLQRINQGVHIPKSIYLMTSIRILVLLSIMSGFTSCQESATDNSSFVLLGEVRNESIGSVYLLKENGLAAVEVIDSTGVENNRFKFECTNITEGTYGVVSTLSKNIRPELYGYFYLVPNDTLRITFTKNENLFSGKTAHIQEYLNYAYKTLEKDSVYKNIYQNLYAFARLELLEASALIDSIRSKEIRIFNDFISDDLLPEKFKAIAISKIEYNAAIQHYKYLQFHKGISEDKWEYFVADSSYYTFLEKVDLNSDDNYLIYPYAVFMEYHLNDVFIRTNQLYDAKSQENYLKKDSISKLTFKTEWIKNNLSGLNQDIALSTLYEKDFDRSLQDSSELFYRDLEVIHAYFANNYSSSEIFNKCEGLYNDYLKIKPGVKAPELNLPDTNGEIVKLDNLKGKVVYIDFWGTWCGSCIAAIPDHRELQNIFSGQDVVFLNVALEVGEREIDTWKKFLRENDFPGIHVVAKNQFSNEYIMPYRINWAPTYILIDKEGKIASAKAPGPYEAEELIKALLN